MAEQKMIGNLKTDILARVLTPEELDRIIAEYRKGKYTKGPVSRDNYLEAKITENDMELLKLYLTETDTPVKEIAERLHTTSTVISTGVRATALRFLYQNMDKLS